MHPKFSYRPEIDGLRAIAIVAVVLFHYFPKTFPFGYLGVDLFFVISGFLITSIICSELKQQTFSLIGFWSRRIVRLLPALIIVLMLVWAVGWLTLTPTEYATLGKHLFGSTFFFQNFILWNEVGYFDAKALQKPLLHLWSLSIEEQFYIVWPLLVLLCIKRTSLLLGVSGCLTAVSIFIAFKYNQVSHPAHFYLPFVRGWELSSGALLAYSVHAGFHKKLASNKAISTVARWHAFPNFLFSPALLVISYSLFLGTHQLTHESKNLILVVATLTIIVAAEKNASLRKLLAFPLLTYIGRISYPLYLYHWPLLSFSTIQFTELSLATRCVLILIAILLAALTYRYVELPIQKRAKNSQRSKYAIGLLGLLMSVGLIAAYTHLTGGFRGRFNFDTAKVEAALSDWKAFNGEKHEILLPPNIDVVSNTQNPPEILFLGDSFAVQYFPKVMDLTRKGLSKNVAFLTDQGCFPIKNFKSNSAPCGPFYERMTAVLENNPTIKTIIISQAWHRLCTVKEADYGIKVGEKILNVASGEFGKDCFDIYAELINAISPRRDVYVIAAHPIGPEFGPKGVFYTKTGARYFPIWKGWKSHTNSFSLSDGFKKFENDFATALKKTNAKIIWTSKVICPDGQCQPFAANGEPKYYDDGHFRSKYVISEFDEIAEIVRKRPKPPIQ